MKCFYRSKPFDEERKHARGYRQRTENGEIEDCLNQQSNVCDQARAVRKNGWLSQLELEAI